MAVVEKPAWESDASRASCREPGVEVGLGAFADGSATRFEVVEEALGGSDFLAAAVGDGWAELAVAVGLGSCDDVPAGVAAQRLLMSGIGDFVYDDGSESSESGGVLVAFGQDACGDEEGA